MNDLMRLQKAEIKSGIPFAIEEILRNEIVRADDDKQTYKGEPADLIFKLSTAIYKVLDKTLK